jgi:hypothetical protein
MNEAAGEEGLETGRPARRRSRLVVGARLLIVAGGFAILFVLLDRIGWRDLSRALRRIGLDHCGLIVALGWLEHLLDSYALRVAMLRRVGFGWTLGANSAGGLVNQVIPYEAGEVVKMALLRQASRSSEVVTGLLIWNYVWKLARPLALVVFLGAALLLGHTYPRFLQGPVALAVLFSFVPYLALRIILRQRPAERLARFLSRRPRLERRAAGWIETAIRIDHETRHYWAHYRREYLQVFLLVFGARLLAPLGLGIYCYRLDLPNDAGSVAFLQVLGSVSEFLVMLVPARVGVGEGAGYLLFRLLQLDPSASLAMAIVGRVRSLLVSAPPALVLWLLRRRRPPRA